MADKSKIEWTDASWNPVTGCLEVSPGCDNCYARVFAERWRGVPGHSYEQGFDLRLWPERLEQPLRWKKPRRIFVNSMSDLFHKGVPEAFIRQVFEVMEKAHWHTFQILTKRPQRLARLAPSLPWPANVWMGVSVESNEYAWRIDHLLKAPAAVRFISAEPLLGALDLSKWIAAPDAGKEWDCLCAEIDPSDRPCPACEIGGGIHWIIAGGESGHGARPMHPDWARALRDQCVAAEIPFFFKQWGEWLSFRRHKGQGYIAASDGRRVTAGELMRRAHYIEEDDGRIRVGKKLAGRLLDGREWNEFPQPQPLAEVAP